MGISAASLWISMPTRRKLERGYALLLLIALFFIGYVLGLRWSVSPPQAGYLTFFAVLGHLSVVSAPILLTSSLLDVLPVLFGEIFWLTTSSRLAVLKQTQKTNSGNRTYPGANVRSGLSIGSSSSETLSAALVTGSLCQPGMLAEDSPLVESFRITQGVLKEDSVTTRGCNEMDQGKQRI